MDQLSREIGDILVPELFLAYHENCGGHALSRHVGVSAQDLRNRISENLHLGDFTRYSRFFGTREEVLPLIHRCLTVNLPTVSKWLGNDKPLELLCDFPAPIGDALVRGASWHQTLATSRIVVVLVPAVIEGRLFRVITAYPDFDMDEVDAAWDAIDEWALQRQRRYAEKHSYDHPAES